MKTVGLPSDSALVINTRNQREAEREEQQQLKQLVLEYEVREEANQRAGKDHISSMCRKHDYENWGLSKCAKPFIHSFFSYASLSYSVGAVPS